MCEEINQYNIECTNAHLLEDHLIMDKETVVEELVSAKRIYFYDVCSIVGHGKSENKQIILEYFKEKADIVVITEMVYIELCKGGSIDKNELDMLLYLANNGIRLYKMKEEWMHDLLVELRSVTDRDTINQHLIDATCAINKSYGTISRLLHKERECSEEERELCKVVRLAYLSKNKHLNQSGNTAAKELRESPHFYSYFFEFFRERKESQDGMGEELIMVVSHLFTHAEYGQRFITTEDRSMAGKVSIVNKSIEDMTVANFRPLKICTTPSIVYWAIRSDSEFDESQLTEFLECSKANPESGFNVAYSHVDMMGLMRKKFTSSDLIQRIIDDPEFMINY